MSVVISRSGFAAIASALLFSVTTRAEQIEVSAHLDPTLIGAGQIVTLTLEAKVEGGIDLTLDPQFVLDNLEIVAGPSQSQQVSFVNGRVSRSQTLSWSLRALEVGTARVRSLTLTVNEQLYELPEQVLEVQAEPIELIDPFGRSRRTIDPFEDFFDPLRRRRNLSPAAKPKLFLRAEATPKDPYVGEQVLYSLLLFTQTDIGAVNPDKMPDFQGLWTVEIEQPKRPKSVMTEIQGERYGRVVLLQRALFPLRPGPLRVDPVEATLVAKIPDYSWMGVIGSFDKEFHLASNAVSLDVRPLPEPPQGFRGAVGDLSLEAVLEPREIHVGEAATLTVSLSGRGHVDGLEGPQLPPLEGMRVYPPQKSGRDRAVGTTVRGEKSWSYVLVPERPGIWEIPIPEYRYFDPQAEAYLSTESQPQILVAKASEQGAPPVDDQETATAEISPSPPAKTEDGESRGSLGVSRWLAPLAALALIPFVLPAVRRLTGRWKATAHLRRELRNAAALEKPRAAAQAIEEAWREFLHQRWHVPTATPPGDWPSRLSDLGIAANTISEVQRLADDLHYLRYAPELSAYDSLRSELVERARRLARALA